ncbi:hypothetical protein [Pseudarthrobacter phenanthrenivorans]|jgi:hypothetical protein|uniref:hypothetical protein n=1 Tax=Pseudarthrobacter phenanthrenivorans TaxID=361575 RepID=UPI001603C94F|nr:hypothetical protein [Pseudarthrobacter phenanthrenivorans]
MFDDQTEFRHPGPPSPPAGETTLTHIAWGGWCYRSEVLMEETHNKPSAKQEMQ